MMFTAFNKIGGIYSFGQQWKTSPLKVSLFFLYGRQVCFFCLGFYASVYNENNLNTARPVPGYINISYNPTGIIFWRKSSYFACSSNDFCTCVDKTVSLWISLARMCSQTSTLFILSFTLFCLGSDSTGQQRPWTRKEEYLDKTVIADPLRRYSQGYAHYWPLKIIHAEINSLNRSVVMFRCLLN